MANFSWSRLAAQYAQKIVADGKAEIENLITKSLGVLQEQGVYACMLFLLSRTSNEKGQAEKVRPHLYNLLKELPTFSQSETEFISPDTRTGQPVFLTGKLYSKIDLPAPLEDWQNALKKLQVGAERGYGWGRLRLNSCDKQGEPFTTEPRRRDAQAPSHRPPEGRKCDRHRRPHRTPGRLGA